MATASLEPSEPLLLLQGELMLSPALSLRELMAQPALVLLDLLLYEPALVSYSTAPFLFECRELERSLEPLELLLCDPVGVEHPTTRLLDSLGLEEDIERENCGCATRVMLARVGARVIGTRVAEREHLLSQKAGVVASPTILAQAYIGPQRVD